MTIAMHSIRLLEFVEFMDSDFYYICSVFTFSSAMALGTLTEHILTGPWMVL